MIKFSLLLGLSQARLNGWQRGPRPDYSDTELPANENKFCKEDCDDGQYWNSAANNGEGECQEG